MTYIWGRLSNNQFQTYLQARNKEQEKEVLEWIFQILGEAVPKNDYELILKDGVVLCKLGKVLKWNSCHPPYLLIQFSS